MLIYPLIVAVVSLAFGGVVLSQWASRRRAHQLAWGVALFMAAVASFSFAGFLGNGSELLFRLYYAFGGLLMAAYLGMGSLYLVLSKRLADLILAILVTVSAIGVALILVAPVDTIALHQLQHTSGEGTNGLKVGLWLLPVILLNTFGAVAVILVALYSAYKVWQRQAPARFFAANVTIAIGTGIISAAGSTGRLGLSPHYFWIIMTVGWVVIFAGFLLTTKLAALGAHSSRDLPLSRGAAV